VHPTGSVSVGEKPRLRWSAGEVLRDLHEVPHLLARLTLTGPFFPPRSAEPCATVGTVRSRFVLLLEDGMRADAYFDRRLPDGEPVAFGYGRRIAFRFPGGLKRSAIRRLDRTRLPQGIRIPDGL
jgi:hypothetical protein